MDIEDHGYKLKTTNREVVDEYPYGMYVWRMPDGEVLGDDEGNFMNVFSTKNNPRAIKAITEAARAYGFPEGKAEWWPGKRRITDEEYEEQLAREAAGLVPDPLDIAAIRDEAKALRQHGRA
jgi:hypothetical protein